MTGLNIIDRRENYVAGIGKNNRSLFKKYIRLELLVKRIEISRTKFKAKDKWAFFDILKLRLDSEAVRTKTKECG